MSNVISLAAYRAARQQPEAEPTREPMPVRRAVTVWFDLRSPWWHLAVERVDVALPGARWVPALEDVLTGRPPGGGAAAMAAAEQRAAELGLPLVWPARWPAAGRASMRAAALAAQRGRVKSFALAAARLQFCGGFDLDEPDVLAEAAAAAGLDLDESLAAARDRGRDVAPASAAAALARRGVPGLPAFAVGRTLLPGEAAIPAVVEASGGAARRLALPTWAH